MLMTDNLLLFRMPWAYLRRNLSGKYRVTLLAGDRAPFSALLGTPNLLNLSEGIYIALAGVEHLARVDLIESDADATDFLYANGQFTDDHYETLSYVTNERGRASSKAYLIPVTQLPASHTEGLSELDTIGNCWTNIPQAPSRYIDRLELQNTLREQLLLTRHEIVTLTGPGGIGKTTLALRVLHELLKDATDRYYAAIWFSARDIDLLAAGPKPVRPHLVTLADFARELLRLISASASRAAQRAALETLGNILAEGVVGPTLFVFDNFETVDSPVEVYKWLARTIRGDRDSAPGRRRRNRTRSRTTGNEQWAAIGTFSTARGRWLSAEWT